MQTEYKFSIFLTKYVRSITIRSFTRHVNNSYTFICAYNLSAHINVEYYYILCVNAAPNPGTIFLFSVNNVRFCILFSADFIADEVLQSCYCAIFSIIDCFVNTNKYEYLIYNEIFLLRINLRIISNLRIFIKKRK